MVLLDLTNGGRQADAGKGIKRSDTKHKIGATVKKGAIPTMR